MGSYLVQSGDDFMKNVDGEQLDVMEHTRLCELSLSFSYISSGQNSAKEQSSCLGVN